MKNTFLVLFGLMLALQFPLQAQPRTVVESKNAHKEWKAKKKREKEEKKRARRAWKENRKSGKSVSVKSNSRSWKSREVIDSKKTRPKSPKPSKSAERYSKTSKERSSNKGKTNKIGRAYSRESKLINEAYEYLGVRYKWGGENPRTGFDCSGFTQFIFESYGVKLPRNSAEQAKIGTYISIKKLEKGDLVFFADKGNKISHVGIVISKRGEPLKMIHASSSEGITVTEIGKSKYWSSKIQYGRRVNR